MFQLDVMSRTPVYEQIIGQFEEFVLTGVFRAGDKIPSVRNLSVQLSINPNTIQKAYTELERRGLTCSVPGKGVFVSENAASNVMQTKKKRLGELQEIALDLKKAGMDLDTVLDRIREIWS